MPICRSNRTTPQVAATSTVVSVNVKSGITINRNAVCLVVVALTVGLATLAVGAVIVWLSISGRFDGWSSSSNPANDSRFSRRSTNEQVTHAGQSFADFTEHFSPKPVSVHNPDVYCDPKVQFRCDVETCVHAKLKCNKKRDCPKGEDEQNCTCVDYLKSVNPQQICDGFPDCIRSEDEIGCDDNCEEDEFRCLINGVCINVNRLCDDVNDCADGADESVCWSLAPSVEALLDGASMQIYEYGFLFGRRRGAWYPACVDSALFSEIATEFCLRSQFRFLLSNDARKYRPAFLATKYLRVKMTSKSASKFILTDTLMSCSSGLVAYLACGTYASCGNTPYCKPPTKRIVGGRSAGQYCHPWTVALYKNGELTCHAVVITDRWLLTAAHCFAEGLKDRWMARLGFYRQYSHSPTEEVRWLDGVVLHANYSEDPVETNDLALVLLDRPVKFGFHIQPPCLPSSDSEAPAHGDKCVTVGWGYTDERNGRSADELQSVELTVVDTAECNRSGEFKGKLSAGHLCLSHGEERKDACQGDSGGPLLCRRTNGAFYLAGVTSTGYGCARPSVPSIWTRLGFYLKWIETTLNAGVASSTLLTIENTPCSGFSCRYGDCVYNYFQCDSQWNCLLDGEDELSCNAEAPACQPPLVPCHADGSCIPSYKLCDYVVDCPDGEDESFCVCDATDVKCPKSNYCAPSFFNASLKFTRNSTIMDKFC